MVIDGRIIAREIFDKLTDEVETHKVKPHLAIVLIGEDPVWLVYVRQKEKKTAEIGGKTTIYHLPSQVTNQRLIKLLDKLNKDLKTHGIIIQRPLPPQIEHDELALEITPEKDVDGFHPKTKFPMPVAEAVMRILEGINRQIGQTTRSRLVSSSTSFRSWLLKQKIVVIGKGETAGKPVFLALEKLGAHPQAIDSKTENPQSMTKKADILISCVGKANIIKPKMLKRGVVLIGVGLHQNPEGKLAGDYEESQIEKIASFYTPIPGGVGPVNVACLLDNLVKACYK